MLAYDAVGDGDRTIVLLHGWCCHRGHMQDLRVTLKTDSRVVSADLPGHGESAEGPTDFPRLAEIVAEFLDLRDIHDPVLVGHSMGGVLSMMVAGMRPVAGVINLDGAMPLSTEGRAGYIALSELVSEHGFAEVMRPFIRKHFFLPPELGSVAEKIIADMVSIPENRAVAILRQFPLLDGDSILRSCAAPLLCVGGSKPRFDAGALVAVRPDAWISQVAISGHFVQIFSHDQVAAMVRQFIRKN